MQNAIDYNNRSAILSMALTIFRNPIYQRKKTVSENASTDLLWFGDSEHPRAPKNEARAEPRFFQNLLQIKTSQESLLPSRGSMLPQP